MVTQLVSSKTAIAKIMADLNLQEHELRISDIRSWIAEAVEKIGGVTKLNHKVSGVDGEPILKLSGHQVQLPCDLHQLQQVAYSRTPCGPWYPMRKATGSFAAWDENTKGFYHPRNNTNTSEQVQYIVKPGFIMSNMRDGFLKLSYNAIPVDDDYYPMIPNMASYQEAIYWYVAMKMMYPQYLRGELPSDRYSEMRKSWNFYRQQAYAEVLMPNLDELESIKNNWNKFYPELGEHDTFYTSVGEEQDLYNQQ